MAGWEADRDELAVTLGRPLDVADRLAHLKAEQRGQLQRLSDAIDAGACACTAAACSSTPHASFADAQRLASELSARHGRSSVRTSRTPPLRDHGCRSSPYLHVALRRGHQPRADADRRQQRPHPRQLAQGRESDTSVTSSCRPPTRSSSTTRTASSSPCLGHRTVGNRQRRDALGRAWEVGEGGDGGTRSCVPGGCSAPRRTQRSPWLVPASTTSPHPARRGVA